MADNMLGTLAKWLRVAGVDCEYALGMDDDGLVSVARGGRLVLTRDRLLAMRCAPNALHVPSDVLEEQLRQVLSEVPGLLGGEPLSRCLVCNVPIEDAAVDEVRDRVPPGVLARTTEFWRCPRCGRVYWAGTHVAAMESRLGRIMEQVRAGRPPEGG
jgi:uncharacterized protein with PIN domain